MIKLYASIAAVLATSCLAATAAAADGPSAQEIVEQANCRAYYEGNDGRAQVDMTITDAQGRERRRQFTILRLDGQEGEDGTCGAQKYYVYFSRPADVSKMVFMVWKNIGKDDDRWLYLPALDLVKRIAASDERTSFVGSQFFYEDVSGRNTTEDSHELVETTDNFYVIRSTPKDPDAVEFAHFKSWIHRASFIPVKIEYYDAAGAAYRAYSADKVDTIEGHATVTQARMQDLRTKDVTTLSYSKVTYDLGLPDDIFTERYLRNAPRKYLR